MYGKVGSSIAMAAPNAVNIHRSMSDNNWFGCIAVVLDEVRNKCAEASDNCA